MDPQSWSRVRELFAAAVLLDPGERSSFLDANCGEEVELRREIESLLRHDRADGDDAIADAVRQEARRAVDAEEPSAPDPLVGKRVEQIRVLKLLGQGGMGNVYVGFDETLQRRVALKAIRARHRLAAGSRTRFLREARMLSQLEHPNICRIHNYIEGEESDFLVLELIEGRDLAEAIAEGLEPALKMKAAIQIAAVLEAAHGQGVVHRDLKPQNVMITPEGEAKVLDFGLARSEEAAPVTAAGWDSSEPTQPESVAPKSAVTPDERTLAFPNDSAADTALASEAGLAQAGRSPDVLTRRGQLVGTPAFMSPEQARGETATTASDMYSFGLLLQALFSGTPPHPAGLDALEILRRAGRAETLSPTGIDKDLAALIERLKSAAPAARPTAVAALERLRWIRDKPKRRLRWLVAAAIGVLIALGGAKYTFDLKVARDEANRRRDQAESLIGFMIGDLRTRLAPVNRLEVLDTIGDKALDYFAAVPAEELSSRELLFRSQTLSQIGQVRMDQGDLPAALEAFEEALGLARGLAEREPENVEWSAWLGAAHFWVGSVDWMRGDLDRALTSFRDYLDVSRALVERRPDNLDWQLELSYAHNNIGSVLLARGDAEGAIEAFQASLEIKARLVASQPENALWQRDLAGTHSWLGEAFLANADLGRALENYEANRTLLQTLVRQDGSNSRWRDLLGVAHGKVALVLEAMGRSAEARGDFEAYLAVNLALTQADPDNLKWSRELAVSHLSVGQLLLRSMDYEPADRHLGAAERILDHLVASDPTNFDWRGALAATQIARARLLTARGSAHEAGSVLLAAASVLDAMLAEQPDDPTAKRRRSEADLALAEAYLRTDLADQAAPLLRSALDNIEPLTRTSRNPLYRELQARALLKLGRIEEARPLVADLHRDGFHRADFARLCAEEGVWP